MSSVKAHPHSLPSQSRVGLELSVESGVGRLSDCLPSELALARDRHKTEFHLSSCLSPLVFRNFVSVLQGFGCALV